MAYGEGVKSIGVFIDVPALLLFFRFCVCPRDRGDL